MQNRVDPFQLSKISFTFIKVPQMMYNALFHNVQLCFSHDVNGIGNDVCLRTGVLECLDDASLHLDFTFVSLVSGHPRPPVVTAPVYRGCPCRDPLGCLRCPGRTASGAEDREGQVEVEGERGELQERRTCTWMTSDETQT